MAEFGHIAIVGALALAVYGIVASVVGARWRLAPLVASGQNAAVGVTVLLTAASGALIAAFLVHDFSLRYVFDHSSRSMPPDLILAAFYSGQQGSLLYWAWTLSIFTAVVLWQQRRPGPHRQLMPYVVAVLLAVAGFMALILGFVASPFERLPFAPPDGVGLNPLLYDEGMRIHPPMLLAGYMSWTVPFAFAIAALATGRLGNEWVALARRYAMVAWLILGLGNLLGAWWAYRVLGWGGYWGWDPVENVALMPWLTGTAFIHSIQVQERRGMLKSWNVALIMVTFFLCIFGTFVVRSGVLASVHSFALSGIGPYFFVYLGVVIFGSLALFFWRLPRLRSENQLDSLLSREASFLLNNLLFLGVTFAIFWGTIYPLISELAGAGKITVGPPYFRQVVGPILGALLVLMGVGPLMPWRRATPDHLGRSFLVPVGAAFGLGGMLFALGVRDGIALVGFTICLFVVATIVQGLVKGTDARHRATGDGYPSALLHLVQRNNRRYGGYVVHLGMVLIGFGAIGSHVYQREASLMLEPGQTFQVGEHTLRFQSLQSYSVPGAQVVEAPMVLGNEVLRPQKVFFKNFEQQPSTKVAIRSSLTEDVYIVLSGWSNTSATARVSVVAFVNPLITWIWGGGIFVLLGTLVALWPAARVAMRAAPAPVPRGAVGAAS